jgi:hypothetical protein
METIQILIYVVIAIIILYIIYWIYKQYTAENRVYFTKVKLLEKQNDATIYKIIDKNKIPTSVQGNEYAISFWLFVKDYNYRYGSNKSILYRADKENIQSNPYIYFNPTSSDITIKVQVQGNSDTTTQQAMASTSGTPSTTDRFQDVYLYNASEYLKSNISGNVIEDFTDPPQTTPTSEPNSLGNLDSRLDRLEYQMGNLLNPTTPPPRTTTTTTQNPEIMYDECTIQNIPIQKWTHLVFSVYNNNIEIYLDGKLHQTCALKGYPVPNLFNMHVCPNGGFNGYISNLEYSDMSLPIDTIYSMYKAGPKLETTFMDKIKGVFSGLAGLITG